MPRMKIQIKNIRRDIMSFPYDVRVDRMTVLGNPFIGNRDSSCDQYEEWFFAMLENNTSVYKKILRIRFILQKYDRLNLFCWCAPLRCHSETIRDYLLTSI